MGDPAVPDNLASRLRELEARIRNLETSPRLKASSIKGGTLEVLDSSGRVVAALGALNVGNGVLVLDPVTGQPIQIVTDAGGQVIPYLANPWRSVSSFTAVTSGTFVDVWTSRIEILHSVMVRFVEILAADAATVGEVRLLLNGVQLGSTVTLVAGTATQYEFAMAHGQTLGSGPHVFTVQARRTSGAGTIPIYEPSGLTLGASAVYGGAFPTPAGGWH